MAKKIYSKAKIIEELNASTPGPWQELEGVHLVMRAAVNGSVVDQGQQGMVVKYFLNSRTAEIRSFVAKWIDEPETNDLV